MNSSCPKCGINWPDGKPLPTIECPACGVIFAKFYAAQEKRLQAAAEQQAKAARAAEKAKVGVLEPAPAAAAASAPVPRDDPAPGTKRGSRMVRFAAALVGLVVVAWAFAPADRTPAPSAAATYERCPDITPASLWLPAGHEQARDDFIAKAYLLNSRGQCVLDGSYGESTRMYYYSVRPLNETTPKHVRFTRDDLRPGR